MEAQFRNQKLSLIENLEKNAYRFSFEMAAFILEYGSQYSFGKENNIFYSPFRTHSINSFHLRGTEIEKIKKLNGISTIYIQRLSIAGINAPLPTPYAELVFRRSSAKDIAMAEFVNIFNLRLLGISYQISRRRHLNLQNHSNKNCLFIKTLAAFCGEDQLKMDRIFSRISYLFWTKEKSASGLESLIKSIFQLETQVKQLKSFWYHKNETTKLGMKNIELGKNSELGKKVSLSTFGIEIDLTHDDYKKIYRILVDTQYLNDLKFFIRKYIGDFLICYINVIPKSVPLLKLFQNNPPILGKTAWFPAKNNLDPAKINAII
jgi:type VI secretion system protein ImpH